MIGGYQFRIFEHTKKVRKWVQKDTQKLRVKLINDLESMFDTAKKAVKAEGLTPKQVQAWMRVLAYLGQIMNSLSRSFDEAKALEYLEKLEKMVNETKGSAEKR